MVLTFTGVRADQARDQMNDVMIFQDQASKSCR